MNSGAAFTSSTASTSDMSLTDQKYKTCDSNPASARRTWMGNRPVRTWLRPPRRTHGKNTTRLMKLWEKLITAVGIAAAALPKALMTATHKNAATIRRMPSAKFRPDSVEGAPIGDDLASLIATPSSAGGGARWSIIFCACNVPVPAIAYPRRSSR